MNTVWVLVADEAIARILEQPQEGGDLVSVEELTDPGAHARERDLHHAPHGRRAGAGSNPQGTATVSASDSERHQQAQGFATRIADRLVECLRDKRYDLLHIVAAPRMLGYLRKALAPAVVAAVGSTQDKDLVQQSNAELSRRLADELRVGMVLEAR